MAEGKGRLRQEESTASCTCNSSTKDDPNPFTEEEPSRAPASHIPPALDEATEAVKLQHRSPHSQAQKQVHGLYLQLLQAILMSVYSLGPRTLPTAPHSTKRIILTAAGSEGNLYNTQRFAVTSDPLLIRSASPHCSSPARAPRGFLAVLRSRWHSDGGVSYVGSSPW